MNTRVNTNQQCPLTTNMANHVLGHIQRTVASKFRETYSPLLHTSGNLCAVLCPSVQVACREAEQGLVARHEVDKGLEHSTGEEMLREQGFSQAEKRLRADLITA